MNRVATIILNAAAGSARAEEATQLISRIAAEEGVSAHVLVVNDPAQLTQMAGRARQTSDMVVAGGGDGTVGAVAAALVSTGTPLGILPLGTLNHFAKDLNIPLELEPAVRLLFTGSIARVDVGEVNGRVFINNSSIGLYPQIVREREKQQRRGHGKWVAFAAATAHVLRRAAALHTELLDKEGVALSRESSFLFVGNNRYLATGLEIGRRATLDGGMLWVCAGPRAGRGKLFVLAVAALFGRIDHADLTAFETMEGWVRTRHRHIDVATDGEVNTMRTPLHYLIRPAALRVVVPATE